MGSELVPVKGAAKSKINWTQIIGIVSMFLAYFGFELTPEDQTMVIGGIGVVTAIVTWILRTWFNRTVTPT